MDGSGHESGGCDWRGEKEDESVDVGEEASDGVRARTNDGRGT